MSCPYRKVLCIGCAFLSTGDKFLHDKIHEECPSYKANVKDLIDVTIRRRIGGAAGSVFLAHQQNPGKPWWDIVKEQLEEIGHKVTIETYLSY